MNQVEENEPRVEDGFKELDTKEPAEVEVDKKPSFLREVSSYIILIVVAFLAAQVIHRYLFTPVTVDGPSMNPTLNNGDILFLSRLKNYERLDVVVFEAPDTFRQEFYIKRLIGLPGDSVEYIDTQLYINGELIEEPYADKSLGESDDSLKYYFTLKDICDKSEVNCPQENGVYKIPEGYFLVMGDNRNNSNDSRYFGLVEEERFVGEAKFVLFPLNRFGKINSK